MNISIKNYYAEVGVHCELSSVCNAISNFNDSIDDSIIFFMEDGFNTEYMLGNTSAISQIILSNHMENKGKAFLERYHVDYLYKHYTKDMNTFQIEIEEKVRRQIPYIISVDTRFLEHNRIYKKNIRRNHVLVILGISNDGYRISDCYVPTSPVTTYEGLMNFRALENAWVNTNKRYIDIDFEKIRKIKLDITSSVLGQAVKNNLMAFMQKEGGNLDESCIGRLANDLPTFITLFPEAEINTNLWELSFKIQFDSIIPARKLLKKVLIRLSKEVSSKDMWRWEEDVDTIIEKWTNITYMIIKAGFGVRKSYFRKISDYMRSVLEYELALFTDICSSL